MTGISITSFLISFLSALLLLPVIIKLSFKKGFLDKPNERKIHSINVPRLGGTTFLPMCGIAFVCAIVLAYSFDVEAFITDFELHKTHYQLGLVGAILLYFVGVYDDLWGVRYRNKFLAQICAGLLLCLSGFWIDNLYGIFGLHELTPWLGWPITIFAIVYVTNAINFIDGIDGLAGCLCAFALLYDVVLLYVFGRNAHDLLVVTLSALGPLVAFLWYNLFGNAKRHTKTFMGDTGSLFMGYVLCALGIGILRCYHASPSYNPMVLGFAPMVLPCFDVIRVVLKRLKQGANPFIADKNHIHHKFLSHGLSQHNVLIIVLLLSMLLSALTILLSVLFNVNVVLLIMLVFWMVFNMAFPHHDKLIKQQYEKKS